MVLEGEELNNILSKLLSFGKAGEANGHSAEICFWREVKTQERVYSTVYTLQLSPKAFL